MDDLNTPVQPDDRDDLLKPKRNKLCCGELRVILNYMVAEQQRKSSSLKIGIFTVFLVVTIITMLESVVSITPILFVKIGQETAGAIDFKLTYSSSDLVNGNVNLYAVNPFNLNYSATYAPLPPASQRSSTLKQSKRLRQIIPTPSNASDYVKSNGDNILLGGAVNLLNFTWYNERLGSLPGFDGFTPRTTWPSSVIGANQKNVTNILLIIDSLHEQQIGLAPFFNPYIIGNYEVMLN